MQWVNHVDKKETKICSMKERKGSSRGQNECRSTIQNHFFFSMKLKFAMQLSHINSVKTVAQSRNRFATRTNQ